MLESWFCYNYLQIINSQKNDFFFTMVSICLLTIPYEQALSVYQIPHLNTENEMSQTLIFLKKNLCICVHMNMAYVWIYDCRYTWRSEDSFRY